MILAQAIDQWLSFSREVRQVLLTHGEKLGNGEPVAEYAFNEHPYYGMSWSLERDGVIERVSQDEDSDDYDMFRLTQDYLPLFQTMR